MEHGSAPRASLACMPCRNQHLKCDAVRPTCSRCRGLSRSCSYPESRRSGKYRTASALKSQRRVTALHSPSFPSSHTEAETEPLRGSGSEANESPASFAANAMRDPADADFIDRGLLDLYYEYFHPSHPFALPREALHVKLLGHAEWPNLYPLIATMQHIGSFYRDSFIHRRQYNGSQTSGVVDGFVVQASLLLALAESMCDNRTASESLLSQAIDQAKSIGMNEKRFADSLSGTQSVLSESWRRTWWMLCLVDANFAVIRGDFEQLLADADHDVDLPCHEDDYRYMNIPPSSSSLSEYQNREYALEDKAYSSFAHLIDANRIFVSSLRASTRYESIPQAEVICGDLEASIVGWFLMLPPDQRELAVKPGLTDQLMFQAHMMMYTALAYIHRPLSNLRYDPAEGISTCGPPRPPLDPESSIGHILDHRAHSEKLLQAIRKQNQCLIILPMRAAQLSPFVICMVACGTIAYLVACKFALNSDEAQVARSRIRVSLGTLKHYEDIWPRGRKILLELKRIAQCILQAGACPTLTADVELLAQQDAVFANLFDQAWLYSLESPSTK